MSSSRQVCFLLLLSTVRAALTARVQPGKATSAKTGSGPDKCTVNWRYKPDKAGNFQHASISFGVPGCRLHCSAISDYKHSVMFPKAFAPVQNSATGKCDCFKQADPTMPLFSYPGRCSDEKCWYFHQRLVTNRYEPAPGLGEDTTFIAKPHHGEFKDDKFLYDESPGCIPGGCKDNNDCFEMTLPSMYEGLFDEEKAMIGREWQAVQRGEKELSELGEEAKLLIGQMQQDPNMQNDVLFKTLQAETDGPFTTAKLQEAYVKLTYGSGVSIDKMLVVAGLDPHSEEGLAHVVTKAEFSKFLKPDCP